MGLIMENIFSQDIEGYKEKVKKAKDIVEDLNLEEPYKTNAFNTILQDLLGKKSPVKNLPEDKLNALSSEEDKIQINFKDIPYFDNFDKIGWKDKLLHLLKWAKHNHPEKGLLTSEFVSIFRERFGIPYYDSGKINKEITRRLLKTPLITRKKINQRDFIWFITPRGEEYLKKEEE